MSALIINLDYLAARLHGRRSRMAEGERLGALSRVKSIPDFAQIIFADNVVKTAGEAQRRMIKEWIEEMVSILHNLTGAKARLMTWLMMQYQIINLKVIIRGILSRTPSEVVNNHLFALPAALALNDEAWTKAKSLDEVVQFLPAAPLGRMLRETLAACRNTKEPFIIEAMLDQKYFQEEKIRVQKLTSEERDKVTPLIDQEIDLFHLMLVMRGRFLHGLDPKVLAALHVEGTRLPCHLFEAMLNSPNSATAAKLVLGRVVDSLPEASASTSDTFAAPVPSTFEALAWRRYRKLANRIFRRSLTDFGIITGYLGLRRMEIANLITLSEGIRARLPDEVIRKRMIPPLQPEVAHV